MRWEGKKISFIAFYNWRKIYKPNFQRTLPKKTAKHIGDTRIQMPLLIRMPPLIQV